MHSEREPVGGERAGEVVMAGREPFPQTPWRLSQDPDDDQMDSLRGVFHVSRRQQVQFVGPNAANKSASGTWCADAHLHRKTWCRLLELDFPVKTLHQRSVRYTATLVRCLG